MAPDQHDHSPDQVGRCGAGLAAVGLRVGVGLSCAACSMFFGAKGVLSAGVLWTPILLLGCLLVFQFFRLVAAWPTGDVGGGQPIFETATSALASGRAIGVLALILVPLISIGGAFSVLRLGAPIQDVNGCEFGQVNKGVTTCVSQVAFKRANAAQYSLGAGFLGAGMVLMAALQVVLPLSGRDSIVGR